MSLVRILNVNILQPKAPFLARYKFEITFECISPLNDDLEFKLVYVGSPKTKALDQVLDSLLVGPVPVGINKFIFEADAPVASKIPKGDLVGLTIILLTCLYKGRMFERIGYYVDNAYTDEEMQCNPPEVPVLEKVDRSILASKPRVTRFPIGWGDEPAEPLQQADGNAAAPVDYMAGSDMMDADERIAGSSGDEEESEISEEESDDDNSVVDLDKTKKRDEAYFQSDDDDNSEDDGSRGFDHADGPDEKLAGDMAKGNMLRPSAVDDGSMDICD